MKKIEFCTQCTADCAASCAQLCTWAASLRRPAVTPALGLVMWSSFPNSFCSIPSGHSTFAPLTGCKIQIFSFPFYTLSPEYQIIANFSELVLLCIEADFCTQIRIFQHFSRSTRFSHLRTAPNSKYSQNSSNVLVFFFEFLQKTFFL